MNIETSNYGHLLQKTAPRLIRSEQENEHFTQLERTSCHAGKERLAELLTLLIEEFEEKHYSLKRARPEDILRT